MSNASQPPIPPAIAPDSPKLQAPDASAVARRRGRRRIALMIAATVLVIWGLCEWKLQQIMHENYYKHLPQRSR